MHHYRLTVESLAENVKSQLPESPSVQFLVRNHDDLLKIVEAIRSKKILDEDKSAALAIGLKLFSEIVIERRGDPLFKPLLEPIQCFTRQLKTVQANDTGEI